MHRGEKSYTHSLWEVVDHCLIIVHDPGMRPGPELNRGTLGLVDECSTTELTLHVV